MGKASARRAARLIWSYSSSLRRWRHEKAQALGVPAFWVLHNRVLEAIARQSPRTLDELEGVRGIGARKVEQFGREIIDVVQTSSSNWST